MKKDFVEISRVIVRREKIFEIDSKRGNKSLFL